MKILLVNDDGIKSEKLLLTKKVLEQFGQVIVSAPTHEQSAKSMSLTFGGTTYHKLEENMYSVDGTPADCVNFALLAKKVNPDIVVSGINNGYNIGIDIRYSGTVGAAFQALYFGYPAIALSSDYFGIEMVEKELYNTMKHILDNKMYSKDYVLNVNLPQDKFTKSKGFLNTEVYNLMHPYNPELLSDRYIPKRVYEWIEDIPSDSEQFAYLNGYTSISKVKL